MLDLQQILDEMRRDGVTPLDASVDLGCDVRCLTTFRDGRLVVEYRHAGELLAVAYLDDALSPRVDVTAQQSLGTMDVLMLMAVLNLANSRGAQMSYAANVNRPVIHQPQGASPGSSCPQQPDASACRLKETKSCT